MEQLACITQSVQDGARICICDCLSRTRILNCCHLCFPLGCSQLCPGRSVRLPKMTWGLTPSFSLLLFPTTLHQYQLLCLLSFHLGAQAQRRVPTLYLTDHWPSEMLFGKGIPWSRSLGALFSFLHRGYPKGPNTRKFLSRPPESLLSNSAQLSIPQHI